MAAKLLYFGKYSRLCKRFLSSFDGQIPAIGLRYNSFSFPFNSQVYRTVHSLNFLQNQSFNNVSIFERGFGILGKNCTSRTPKRFYSKGRKTSKDTKGVKNLEENDTSDEDLENFEILEELREKTGLEQGHKVLVIQPDFKWGRNRFHLETVDHMLGEALSLVECISGWSVVEGRTEPIRKPDGRYFFGKGKLEELTKLIKKLKVNGSLSAVFLDVGRLTRRQHIELEELWNVKVFDRFSLVIQIFKERAVTSEAKVQVELAELGYLRSRLVVDDHTSYDQQRGGTYSMGGGGETHLEVARRTLTLKQQKLKKKLEAIKKQRHLIRHDRAKRKVPVVSVVGYTNAGKTTLIKALTHDAEMHPEDKLFATLDVTAHRGKLPSGMTALFIDTVGFVSDLPHELVESFSATLEDIVHSFLTSELETAFRACLYDSTYPGLNEVYNDVEDLLIHLRDCSHPEFEAQKVHVLDVLKMLKLPKFLMDNIIEVHNKVDLRELISDATGSSESHFEVSALHQTGLDSLWTAVEDALFRTTERHIKTIIIPQDGPQLSWLHHEATVSETEGTQDGKLKVKVIMDEASLGKYHSKFGKID